MVDQAKGILMHALGCSAADALERMRRVSQTQHVKVTDVAKQIVESHWRRPAGLRTGRPANFGAASFLCTFDMEHDDAGRLP